jgi:hypothetical protein
LKVICSSVIIEKKAAKCALENELYGGNVEMVGINKINYLSASVCCVSEDHISTPPTATASKVAAEKNIRSLVIN